LPTKQEDLPEKNADIQLDQKTKPQLQSPGKKTVFHCSPSVSIHEKRRPNCCEHLVPNDRTNNHGKTIGSNRGFMEA
jgi:hypothetical protein